MVLAEAEGVKCFRASDFDGAIFHFTEAIKHGPSDPAQVLGNRAAAFEKIGDFEAAMADSCAALEASPDYLKGYFRKATSLMALGRYAEASAAADDGLRKQPKNTQLLELKEKARAAVLAARSQEDDEEDEDEESGEEDDDDDDDDDDEEEEEQVRGAHGQRGGPSGGAAATSMEEEEPAEVRAEKAKAAGNAQYKAGQYDAAIRHYSEAVRLAPSNATYLINRAAAALMVQKAEEALEDSTRALELEATNLKAHMRKSKALSQLGRLSEARRSLEAAIEQVRVPQQRGSERPPTSAPPAPPPPQSAPPPSPPPRLPIPLAAPWPLTRGARLGSEWS